MNDNKKILIVEDEKDIRNLLIFNLQKHHYEVDSIHDGEKALPLIRKNKYDLILLDIMLPGVNWFDLTRFIKNDNAFAYPKVKYVEKLTDDGGWRDTVVDDDGNEYSFNIERSDESVIDAMVDLLILSKSTILNTSESTFLKTALLIQESNA